MAPTTTTKTVEEPTPKPKTLSDVSDIIDRVTFEQILEMDDDDEDRDFSKGIVFGFFEQAETTFKDMEEKLEDKDLAELSRLGHYLKGSSATIGLTKVKDACEKIQHYGQRKDETGNTDEPDDEVSLKKIEKTLSAVKQDYKEAKKFLEEFFGEPVPAS